MLRAFAVYFQLANLAEQHHRLRRRREDAHDGRILHESLDAAFAELGDLPADELAARASETSIQLVLTAHPTETTRRSVLLAHIRIQEQLVVLDDPRVSPAERAQAEERIAEEVTLLWQTDEVRHDRLRISDEIRHALWFFEHSLLDAATELLRVWRERLPGAPPPLAFGTWVGGDMDGNPSAGPASIDEALDRARTLALAPLPRRGACARGRDRCCALARHGRGRARRVARAGRARAACIRSRDRRPEHARAVPAQALLHVVAARERRLRDRRGAARRSGGDQPQPGGERRPSRRRGTRGAAAAHGRDVRLPRREARHPSARPGARRAPAPRKRWPPPRRLEAVTVRQRSTR